MMRIDHNSYNQYINSLANSLKDTKLFSPILLNNETIVFPLMEQKDCSLVISLNNKCPLVYLVNDNCFFSGFENKQIQRLRKLLGKSIVKELFLDKFDNVLTINFYNEETYIYYFIVIELIPHHPNLIILDNKNKIIDSYFKSKTRNLSIGSIYEKLPPLEKLENFEILDENLIKNHYQNEWEIRRKEKYQSFLKFINNKLDLNRRKIIAIENDTKNAIENLKYEEIANEIFSLGLDLKSHQNFVTINNKEIKLDPAKTLYENIEHFYKKAKKAKETIQRSEINIANAQKELDEYKIIIEKFNSSNEKEADILMETYGDTRKKKEIKETIFNRPYKINLNGTFIYFGRNASQNDYLSFVMKLDREFTWLHIKDKSGAHLIIANKKPTDNELLTACEISLLCSRANSGEIVYTKKKNVRRGHVLGEALLKNHSTIKLNSIRKETLSLFETAKRID